MRLHDVKPDLIQIEAMHMTGQLGVFSGEAKLALVIVELHCATLDGQNHCFLCPYGVQDMDGHSSQIWHDDSGSISRLGSCG